jgi:hypothetical protein
MKRPDTCLLDCWLWEDRNGRRRWCNASGHMPAWFLAISCKPIEISDKASGHWSAWLLALRRGRNEYHQCIIRTLVCSTAGYLVKVWIEIVTKHLDTCPLVCWLFGEDEMKIANKYPDNRLLDCLLLVMKEWKSKNENCWQSIRTLVRSTAGYLVRTKWKSPTKHPDSWLVDCLLLVMEKWKSKNENRRQSIRTLARSTAGYLVRTKWKLPTKNPDSCLLDCLLLVMEEWKSKNENCWQSIRSLICLTAGYQW